VRNVCGCFRTLCVPRVYPGRFERGPEVVVQQVDTSGFQVEDIRAVDSRVLAFFTLTTLGRISGAETSVHVAGVYDVEDGKLRRARIFPDRAEALAAVGLSE
jgi:hypothetical protein